MEEQEKDTDLINRFFDLALSEEELVIFEKKVANDPILRKKVATYKQANSIVNQTYPAEGEMKRAQKWKKLLITKETAVKTDIRSKKSLWRWMGVVAAGFVLLFSIWHLNIFGQKPNMNELLAASWDKKVGLNYRIVRSEASDPLKQQIQLAYTSYQNKDYQAAIARLNTFKNSMLYYDDALLLRGLSYYRKGALEKALKTLDTLSRCSSKKADIGKWYLGLIYLEEGNTDAAKYFLEIPDEANGELRLKD